VSFEADVARGKELRADRAGMIARARDLLDWLEAHPEVPISTVEIHHSVQADADREGLAELAAIANAAGLPIIESDYGRRHHTIVKTEADDPFGFVNYHAAYIEPDHWKRHLKPTARST